MRPVTVMVDVDLIDLGLPMAVISLAISFFAAFAWTDGWLSHGPGRSDLVLEDDHDP